MTTTTASQAALRTSTDEDCRRVLRELAKEHALACLKAHRVELEDLGLPVIPCLDHEAQLQGDAGPHAAVYVRDGEGHWHELVVHPRERRLRIDAAATLAETPSDARARFVEALAQRFPEWRVDVLGASLIRGDRRIAEVVRAHVRIADVLAGADDPRLRWQLEKLRTIGDLMEKESRVSSWGVRTLTPLVLAGAGFVTWRAGALLEGVLATAEIEALRATIMTVLGLSFLWIGLKAVQLTAMGTRVWKRATEYRLILDARARPR